MSTSILTQVGPRIVQDGSENIARADKTGATVVTDAHGRYYEAAVRGTIYSASNVAAQAVSVALTTTYTGLCLSNPIGSGKNIVLLGGQYSLTVAPAGIASLHLIAGGSSTGVVTHTTVLAAPGVQSTLIGVGAGVAQSGSISRVDSAATIVNPYYLASLGSGFTAAALYATTPSEIDFGGKYVITPGGWVAWGALTAVTGFGSFTWEEVTI